MDMTAAQPEVEQIAKAIGFAISKWGEIESPLCSIFAHSLRAPNFATARDAFYSIVSFQAKIKAVEAGLKRELSDNAAVLAEWAKFKKEAVRYSKYRNEFAHGAVMVVNTEPPTPGWFPFWNGSALDGTVWDGKHLIVVDHVKFHYYTSTKIKELTAEFERVARQGDALFQQIASALT